MCTNANMHNARDAVCECHDKKGWKAFVSYNEIRLLVH